MVLELGMNVLKKVRGWALFGPYPHIIMDITLGIISKTKKNK
jgi:hypothetical protein